jgi:exodeoxyribonuclease VII large subunit
MVSKERQVLFQEKTIFTVGRLTACIRELLEDNFLHVWVEGEVSNLAQPSSGHCYFTLKDSDAQLKCVMFRATARAVRFRLQNGMGLIVRGRLTVYDQRGEYQLVAEYLEPKGIGALQLAFTQVKEKLAAEGLFDECRKKPLPVLPNCIGIVTSATGAAIHDILKILKRRYVNIEVLLYPVKVQGDGAAEEIATGMRELNRYGKVDVILVTRGGGSLEDLWPFNEEIVARAICDSRIPVISAVGHEVDFTIADFVADLRAPTPSAAAELVVKSKAELKESVEALSRRLSVGMRHRLAVLSHRVEGLHRGLKDPSMLLGHMVQRVDDLNDRLNRSMRFHMTRRGEKLASLMNHLRLTNPAVEVERCREKVLKLGARLQAEVRARMERAREKTVFCAGKLDALSPLATLARGYAIAEKMPSGPLVKDSSELVSGDRIRLTLSRGTAVCIVESAGDDPDKQPLTDVSQSV